jgi:acetyl esterase/lipase
MGGVDSVSETGNPQCKKQLVLLFLAGVIGLLLPCQPSGWSQTNPAYKRTEDVIYGRKFGMALTMDVFEPAKKNGAAVIFLVNGAWYSSHEENTIPFPFPHVTPENYQLFLDRGYTVFAVVSSSQPKFIIPDLIEDYHRSVRFIRHNAAGFGVNPDRLGITGSSSGGQLALMIATLGAKGPADAKDPVERDSSEVNAVACFFPPTDYLNWGAPGVDGVGLQSMRPLELAFGPQVYTAHGRQLLGREISPIYFLTSKLPPTLIIHGDADDVVPLQQSESFLNRARELGAPHLKLIVRKGKGHGWGDFWKSAEDINAFADWFDEYLRGIKK